MSDLDSVEISPKKPRRVRRAADAQVTPDTSDPVEIAMKAVATGADRHGSARAVLEKHARLIDIQCEREREEWHVLRVQRMTRWLIMATVIALLLGVGTLIWSARNSSSLVIEPFGVPPSLAQRGLTGRVVSARVLDRLAELQRRTESMRGEKTYANDWQDDIKIAIPETGVSIGDAWRTLKGWLGEETRIGGEVVLMPQGIAITTRAGPLSGGTVVGAEADFERLVEEAAAGIYRVTQPYRYAFSRPQERAAEREQVLMELAGHPSEEERKWALSGLSAHFRMMGDYLRSAEYARRALELDPQLLPPIGNISLAEFQLGRDEAMLASSAAFLRVWRRDTLDDYDARVVALNGHMFESMIASRLGSVAGMRSAASELAGLGGSTFTSSAAITNANAAILARDYVGARAAIRGLGTNPPQARQAQLLEQRIRFREAIEERHAGRAREAAADVLSLVQLNMAALPVGVRDSELRIFRIPELALGFGEIGLGAEATRLAAPLPVDCYECVRAKGWAALASGNQREARRWFEEAVRQAPSVPMGHANLGQLALLQRNPAAALRHFEEASRRGPDWADPLRYRGDILSAQGRTSEALELYRKAAAMTPRWGRLQLNLGDLLQRLGRWEEAKPHLRAAASGALSRGRAARLAALAKRQPLPGG
jgi:tetratricopeptide (TPR) repeat protein